MANDHTTTRWAAQAGEKPAQGASAASRNIEAILLSANMRPTRQRLALADLLFQRGEQHVTAEIVFEEAMKARIPVSLATVYNTLNHLTEAGLLRSLSVDGSKTYFDTNTTAHHHFYFENTHELVDIADVEMSLASIPQIPEGYEIARIDAVVRLRKKL
ncbi:Fur family transcriptional regulator Irr [Bradyrhizobium sp. WSM2254]|uniref:Fur family transcriptional regulator Irr n=1 Tax=Bradyrhizobium sp. WSM2254 TaxID=1188263 RepID=UPI0003F9CB2D|nr:Fur family transcriptional regulator [Bradyrhizobium sp. WSM2254]